jgi:hypothetical protein
VLLQIPVEEVIEAMVEDYRAQLWAEASTQMTANEVQALGEVTV